MKKQNEKVNHTIILLSNGNFSFDIIYIFSEKLLPFIPIYFLTYVRYNTAVLKYLKYYQTVWKIAYLFLLNLFLMIAVSLIII